MSRGLSRRTFLKSAAFAGAATAAGVAVAGCAPQQGNSSLSSTGAEGSSEVGTPVEGQSYASLVNPQIDLPLQENNPTVDSIFSSLKIGGMELSHRMVKSAAGVSGNIQRGGIASEAQIEYFTDMVKGGCDLVLQYDGVEMYDHFRHTTMMPDYVKVEWDPSEMKKLADAVHDAGGHLGYQLATLGIVINDIATQTAEQTIPDIVSLDDIHLLQSDIVAAAKKLQDAGVDMVEINAAGANAGQHFMSRNKNRRTDEYGADTIENRARFVAEIIEGIRSECGPDYPVQVLMNCIEENDAALGQSSLYSTVEETIALAQAFEAAGASSLHLRLGPSAQHIAEFMGDLFFDARGLEGTTSFGTQADYSKHWGGYLVGDRSGMGLTLNVAAKVRENVGIPCGTVTYMDPARDTAFFEDAIADGKIDFMMMNRPFNVDAEYVNKLRDGRIDEIAPCTRCAHCYIDADPSIPEFNYFMGCRVNAWWLRPYRDGMDDIIAVGPRPAVLSADGSVSVTTLPEGAHLLQAEKAKKVMVVGAGPAGMECARIAAQRGHAVTLYEKSASVGGRLEFAHMVKGQHENLNVLLRYLSRQLELTGVNVVTGTEVTSDLIASESPDAVVLAVGGLRPEVEWSSTEGTEVVSIDDFLTADCGENIVVLGHNAQAYDAAVYLMAQGKSVQMISDAPAFLLADGQSANAKAFSTPMFYAAGGRYWPEATVSNVGGGGVTFTANSGVETTILADTVIDARTMLPNTALSQGLDIEHYEIGDCQSPFNIQRAINAGNLCGRML